MKKNIFNFVILAVCLVASLFFIFKDGGQAVFSALKTANLWFLTCAALCMILYWILESSAFRSICRGLGSKISYRNCFNTSMVGQFFNCVTPFATGGQPMQAYRLTKVGMPLGQASCALLAKFLTYQVVLTVYTATVILIKLKFFVTEISGFTWLVMIGFTANTLVMLALLSIGFFKKTATKVILFGIKLLAKVKIVKNYDKTQGKIMADINRFYSDFEILKKTPTAFIRPVIFTTLQLTVFFTVPYFICLSLSALNLDYLTVICAAAFVLLISSFVPLPGGSGGAEGGFYVLFSMFFLNTGFLTVAILLWRIMTFYLPILAGAFFIGGTKKEKQIKAIKAV